MAKNFFLLVCSICLFFLGLQYLILNIVDCYDAPADKHSQFYCVKHSTPAPCGKKAVQANAESSSLELC